MKYYLIDFDNVNTSKDLKGWDTFTSEYYIFLFYTAQKAKIDVSLANKHGDAGFEYVEVSEGKQSLDMHLVSLMGFLINKDKAAEFIIVSKDADYDRIIKFWEAREKARITRVAKITPLKKEEKNVVKESQKAKKTTTVADDSFAKAKTELNSEIQKLLSEKKYKKTVITTVTKIVLEHLGEDRFSANIHNELLKIYTDGSDLYNEIKSLLKKYSSIKKPTTASLGKSAQGSAKKDKPSAEIRQILKAAKKDADTINYVGNLLDAHINDKDYKQLIYRAVISKYGQSQGLDIYNRIKKHL